MRKEVGSNRTIVGLKRWWDGDRLALLRKQQSHHCGIETTNLLRAASRQLCSNRTIVGLKPENALTLLGCGRLQQSHHCGIETKMWASVRDVLHGGSNRTIVGLKQAYKLFPSAYS